MIRLREKENWVLLLGAGLEKMAALFMVGIDWGQSHTGGHSVAVPAGVFVPSEWTALPHSHRISLHLTLLPISRKGSTYFKTIHLLSCFSSVSSGQYWIKKKTVHFSKHLVKCQIFSDCWFLAICLNLEQLGRDMNIALINCRWGKCRYLNW